MQKPTYALHSPDQFSAFVRALRRMRGLTQEELGRKIGVSGARISEIERDPGKVGLTQVLNLLHILGAKAILVTGDERSSTHPEHVPARGEW